MVPLFSLVMVVIVTTGHVNSACTSCCWPLCLFLERVVDHMSSLLLHFIFKFIDCVFQSSVLGVTICSFSFENLFDSSSFILESLSLKLTRLYLSFKHELFSFSLLLLFLEDMDFVDSLHHSLLDHMNASLKSSIFSDKSRDLHLLLPLEHLTGMDLLLHYLNLLLGFQPLLFQGGNFNLKLRFKPMELLDVPITFFDMALQGHQVFIFLSVKKFNLSALSLKLIIFVSQLMLYCKMRLLLHVLDGKLVLN
jgi:hypothetical protein